ncbi:MAG TPA: acyl-CoA dehydrogenase family protein, partial [Chthonomonadaceae bacterium]|nr:acyl-CoA dehydrogenase family protein [Chthonomonadaceae bacterium]
GYGYTEEFPVARAWRDQRLLRIGEGANEIVRLAIVTTLLRREKQGRLPLIEAGRRLLETSAHSQQLSDPLAALAETSRDIRRLALTLLLYGYDRYGDKLAEEEEIAAAIADAINSAYAIESVWLRCEKLRDTPRFQTALLTARVAARDYTDEALAAARYLLSSLPEIRAAMPALPDLVARLERVDASPMQLRRNLAAEKLKS